MTLFIDRLEHTYFERFKEQEDSHFSPVMASRLLDPIVVSSNKLLAKELGIDPDNLDSPEMLEVMSGNFMTANIKPIALVYSGHQFGVWAGQLGDGRAMTLGELPVASELSHSELSDSELSHSELSHSELWDIQLKGAGPTPYSRFADGRAVLRSSIREYLCSEAMHGLGIATTRALSLVDSKTAVYREEVESGATVCRVARSHIRFGSFEHFHYRNQPESVRALADYVVQRHFPQWTDDEDRYLKLFKNTVFKTAKMIAQWQSVGFNHGVMNTDNMSILGDTLDFGPFGFLDNYNPDFICNHSDTNGRYSFKNQPSIGLWNLNALATSLTSLLSSDELIEVLKQYEPEFLNQFRAIMASKLGLEKYQAGDELISNELLDLMQVNNVDYTILFRSLCDFTADNQAVRDQFIDREGFDQWALKYLARLDQQDLSDAQRRDIMRAVNPKYVLRNYMAQAAIEKAQNGDYSEVNLLLQVLQSPCEEHPEAQMYAGLPPDWAEKLSVSCSS
ncbi:YdiU family protein [Porticoccaceae bacterium]|nr:YdiU family protein [Porticoccaceae bacterium]MDB9992877.1 YdiU family protein [Porticoccaceae bacterium]